MNFTSLDSYMTSSGPTQIFPDLSERDPTLRPASANTNLGRPTSQVQRSSVSSHGDRSAVFEDLTGPCFERKRQTIFWAFGGPEIEVTQVWLEHPFFCGHHS